jgi:hypothetical protein
MTGNKSSPDKIRKCSIVLSLPLRIGFRKSQLESFSRGLSSKETEKIVILTRNLIF